MERILIVDDDNSINLMMKEALEREGFACGQAYSGSECILRLQMEHYDLVLLDLALPGKTGEEVLREIRETGNRLPVIVVSAARSSRKNNLRILYCLVVVIILWF